MANNNKVEAVSGVSFWGILLIIFIAFKVANVIDWSWWWVLWPLWLPVAITIAVFLIIVLIKYLKSK